MWTHSWQSAKCGHIGGKAPNVDTCVAKRQMWTHSWPSANDFNVWSPKACRGKIALMLGPQKLAVGNWPWCLVSKGLPLKIGFDAWPPKARHWKFALILGLQRLAVESLLWFVFGCSCPLSFWCRFLLSAWVSSGSLPSSFLNRFNFFDYEFTIACMVCSGRRFGSRLASKIELGGARGRKGGSRKHFLFEWN